MTRRARIRWRCFRRGHHFVLRLGDEERERCLRCGKVQPRMPRPEA